MRYSGVANLELMNVGKDSLSVQYSFFTNGRAYDLYANQAANAKVKIIDDFDTMAKTITFTK